MKKYENPVSMERMEGKRRKCNNYDDNRRAGEARNHEKEKHDKSENTERKFDNKHHMKQ